MAEETDWFAEQAQHERCYWRRVGFVIFLALALVLLPLGLYAGPVAMMEGKGLSVTLYHPEKCQLEAVSNLPFRATWTENGKTFEGCFTIDGQLGIVRMYFEDKSVVAIPVQLFQRVTGA